jgi:hypothetical protein
MPMGPEKRRTGTTGLRLNKRIERPLLLVTHQT